MVLAKGSRKGKKAWRRNIDTQDVEKALHDEVQRQRQSEASARDLPDSELFYVDQAPSEVKVPRRSLKARQPKLLRSQVILQAPQNTRPVKVGPNKRKAVASARQHEDALADAVAAEVSKANALLLRAKPPAKFDLFSNSFEDDLSILQTPEDIELDEDEDPDQADGAARSHSQPRRKTQADRNKAERLRKENQALAERRAQKQKKQDLAALAALQAEIDAAEAERELRRRRRAAVRAERAAAEPARLGKQKYTPLPTQVLLTEELGTGLRAMRAAPVLMKDRFKALQRRGLIETRLPVRGRRPGRRIAYQPGDRADRAAASQAELDSLRRAAKK
ncbi:hypothetical protein WJX73_001246 [Symbiochloris irregularis]|uniref:Ribosome biogenesis protein NOP53 n=1 Tax=Symbiochloris irregularis TaxID=706552 RepID=A0AAW1PRG3_9CHLO